MAIEFMVGVRLAALTKPDGGLIPATTREAFVLFYIITHFGTILWPVLHIAYYSKEAHAF